MLLEQWASLQFKNQNSWRTEREVTPLTLLFLSPRDDRREVELSFPIELLDFKRRDLFASHVKLPELKKKPNLFIFVIESLATRFATESDMPNLTALKKDSISSPYSFANANGTHHAWYSIFASDHPFHYLSARLSKNWRGSPPFIILKRLGYKLKIFDSAGINYLGYDQFLIGPDREWTSITRPPASSTTQWDITDMFAVDHLIQEIDRNQLEGSTANVYSTLFGSTHFPYFWPNKASDPAGQAPNFLAAKISPLEREKFVSQYRSSLRFLDQQLGRITDHLKKKSPL